MDYISVLGIAIGSLGTLLVQYFTKRQEYKLDYYRYIIDKRFKAYERVEILFKQLISCYSGPVGAINKVVSDISDDPSSYDEIKDIYNSVFEMSMWLDEKTGELLSRFNDLMIYYIYYIKDSNGNNKQSFFNLYYDKYSDCQYLSIIDKFSDLINNHLSPDDVKNYISLEALNISCALEHSLIDDYRSFSDVQKFIYRYNEAASYTIGVGHFKVILIREIVKRNC